MAHIPVPVPASRTRFAPSLILGESPSSPQSVRSHKLCVNSSANHCQTVIRTGVLGPTKALVLPLVIREIVLCQVQVSFCCRPASEEQRERGGKGGEGTCFRRSWSGKSAHSPPETSTRSSAGTSGPRSWPVKPESAPRKRIEQRRWD